MNNDKWFAIPHMKLCRADFDLYGHLKEMENINIYKVSDEKMEQIANQISNILLQDWELAIRTVINDRKELFAEGLE